MLYKRVDLSQQDIEEAGGYEIRPRFYKTERAEDGDELKKVASMPLLPSLTGKEKEPPFGIPIEKLLESMAMAIKKPVRRDLEYSCSEDSFTLDYSIPRELRK
jgi:hypothetical protein